MSEPNEQLIAHMQEWIDGKEAFLPDNIGVCIRALLEENKRLGIALHTHKSYDKTASELYEELQQTREELTTVKSESQAWKDMYKIRNEESTRFSKELQAIQSQLSAKDKVLEQLYIDSAKVYEQIDQGIDEEEGKQKALEFLREMNDSVGAILSQYTKDTP